MVKVFNGRDYFMPKLFNGFMCLLLAFFMIIVAGCGEDRQIKEIKNSTLAYSASSGTFMVKKIDGAPKIGDAIDNYYDDKEWKKEWKIEKENGRDYVIFRGTVKKAKRTPGKFLLSFTNRGDYYSLEGMEMNNTRMGSHVQFGCLLALMQEYNPSYDFTKNGIPKDIIAYVEKTVEKIRKKVG